MSPTQPLYKRTPHLDITFHLTRKKPGIITVVPFHLQSAPILHQYDQLTTLWNPASSSPSLAEKTSLDVLMEALHHANFAIWNAEDKARDPNASDQEIVQVKRLIDRTNQSRNDLVEQIDTLLLDQHTPNPQAPLHSETPGLILDRLSILSLKIFHTRHQLNRPDVTAEHIQRNQQRLKILNAQRSDLANCLDRLWQQVLIGQIRFQIYRQLKMYNDPTLNPFLYKTDKS